MMFRFAKLYADLVTDDGVVCVAYVAWLGVLGASGAQAGFELYTPDGRREVVRARGFDLQGDQGGMTITLDVEGGPFVLRQEYVHSAWNPSGAAPHPDLRWWVRAARAEARAWWGNARRPALCGLGYSDWVELRRPTRSLGLRRLEWRRVHFPTSTLVVNEVHFRAGPVWTRAARWDERGGREIAARSSVRLEADRVLHAGDPIDPARFPGAIERWFSGAITGPAFEERCVGRAFADGEARVGRALYETVRFGKGGVA